jgi:hypothetical protein
MFGEIISAEAAEGDKVTGDVRTFGANHVRGTVDYEIIGSHSADGKVAYIAEAQAGAG